MDGTPFQSSICLMAFILTSYLFKVTAHTVTTRQVWKVALKDTWNLSMIESNRRCEYCDYKATEKGNLQRHVKYIPDGVKYLLIQTMDRLFVFLKVFI